MTKQKMLVAAIFLPLVAPTVAYASGDEDYRKHKMCIQAIDTSGKNVHALHSKMLEVMARAEKQRMSQQAFDEMVEQDGSLKKYRQAQDNFEKSKSCLSELQWSKRVVTTLCPGVTLPLKTPQSQNICEELALNFFDQQAVQAHLSQHSKLTVSQRELVKKATLAQKRSVDDAMYEQLKSCNMPSFTSPMYLGERIDGYIASDGLNAAIDHYNSSWSVLDDHLKRFKQQVECRREVVNQAMRQAHQRVMNTPDIRQMLEANELLMAGANDAFMDAGSWFVDSVVSETERQQKVMNIYLKELQDGMRIMSDRIDRARASMELSAEERKRAETVREMARQRERRLQREAQEWSQTLRRSNSSFIGGSGVTVLPGQR